MFIFIHGLYTYLHTDSSKLLSLLSFSLGQLLPDSHHKVAHHETNMRRELNNAAASGEKGYCRTNSCWRGETAICMWLLLVQGWTQGLVPREDARLFRALDFRSNMSARIALAMDTGSLKNNLIWRLKTVFFPKTLLVRIGLNWHSIFSPPPPPALCYVGICGPTLSYSLPTQQSLMSFILIRIYLRKSEQR